MSSKKSPPRFTPVWNKAPFTCPLCTRHFAIATIRIVRYDNAWVCHRCALAATNSTTTTKRYQRVNGVLAGTCATCQQPIGHRRAQTNRNGVLVHYRCPKRKPA